MTVEVGSLTQLEPLLDPIPTPVALVEPGTARVLYVNAAAHRLAGGRMAMADHADSYGTVYGVYDASGRELPVEEHPGVRAARGERFQDLHVDWVTADGRRSIAVSARTVTLGGIGDVALVTFEDVTEPEGARRRAGLLTDAGSGEEVNTILGGV